MVLKVMKFFRGYLFVRLTGYSPERFFNLCGNADIVLWKIEPAEDGYTFFVSLPAFRKLKPMLQKSGTRVTILKRVGVPFLLYRYRHHRFFFVGLGSLFAILFLMTQFIWAVEISGNSSYSGQVLRDFLAESGIGYGSWKRSIDCEKTETLLRREFDDITWVSARISGTRLYVDIQERLKEQNSPESADEAGDMATDLVTDVGGAVESIVVRKGTPLVMQGDLVEPGTIVVSGSLPLENDSGEISGYEYCSSDADVWIRTTLDYKDVFSKRKNVLQKSGKKRYGISLVLGRYQMHLFDTVKKNTLCTGEYYDPRIGRDFYLPFQLIVRTQEDCKWQEIPYTREEIRRIAQQRLEGYCKNLEKNAIQIQEKSVIIKASVTEISVEGTLEALVKASRRTETEKIKKQEGTGTYGIDTTNVGHSD